MSDPNNATARIVEAVNELTSDSFNPGHGREASYIEASDYAYHVPLGRPCVIEGEYEIVDNDDEVSIFDLMD